ncbi:MAG: hypothetical protein SGARI_000311 [Bacillariaceae sp.]
MWTWLADLHCGDVDGNEETSSSNAATRQMHKLGVIFRNNNNEEGGGGGQPRHHHHQRLSALNKALSQHLVKRCNGGANDDDDNNEDSRTLSSATLAEQEEADSLFSGLQKSLQSKPFDEQADHHAEEEAEQGAYEGGLKARITRFLSDTADMLVDGDFGDNETVTLYTLEDNATRIESLLGDDKSLASFFTMETGSFDDTLTLTLDEAPHDEMHQDLRSNKKNLMDDSQEHTKMGDVTFASGESEHGIFSRNIAVASLKSYEEGLEIGKDGVPHQLVVVGYDPPEDCSLLSDASPIIMQAVNRKGKIITSRRR